jgi:hypothetical protein
VPDLRYHQAAVACTHGDGAAGMRALYPAVAYDPLESDRRGRRSVRQGGMVLMPALQVEGAGAGAGGGAGAGQCPGGASGGAGNSSNPQSSDTTRKPVVIEKAHIIRLASQYTPCAGCSAAVKALLKKPIHELRLLSAVMYEDESNNALRYGKRSFSSNAVDIFLSCNSDPVL